MREALFILVVVAILLALTAIRYRKQIVGILEFGRALKDAKDAAVGGRQINAEPAKGQLVNCSKCGVWVPENKAVRQGTKVYCSTCRVATAK